MPLFTYQCQKCKNEFDVLVGVTMDKPKIECPKCHSTDVVKFVASSINVGKGNSASKGSFGGSCSTGCCPTCGDD